MSAHTFSDGSSRFPAQKDHQEWQLGRFGKMAVSFCDRTDLPRFAKISFSLMFAKCWPGKQQGAIQMGGQAELQTLHCHTCPGTITRL